MKLQRLLLVSEPGGSGVFLYVRQLIEFLHARHPEVTVDWAYSSRRSWPDVMELAATIRARGGETLDLRVGNAPEPRDFLAAIQLFRLVRRRAPQLIHAHSSKAGGLCRLLARWPNFPPVLYTPHAYYGMARRRGAKEKFFNGVESFLGRGSFSHVVSADERQFALQTLKLPARSLVLITNGISVGHFAPADMVVKIAARRQLGLPPTGKILVTVGRDSLQKNYAPLYAALNQFLAAQPSVCFAHAGAGALKRREKLDIAARVRCYGFEHLAEVRTLLGAADGFILTSFYEGMAISMLEAISCGLPLLLADAPGLSVMRSYGLQVDWLPNPNHSSDFQNAILKTLTAWNERPAGVVAGQHELARRHFNSQIQFGKIVRLYERLIGKQNA